MLFRECQLNPRKVVNDVSICFNIKLTKTVRLCNSLFGFFCSQVHDKENVGNIQSSTTQYKQCPKK